MYFIMFVSREALLVRHSFSEVGAKWDIGPFKDYLNVQGLYTAFIFVQVRQKNPPVGLSKGGYNEIFTVTLPFRAPP